MKYGKIPLVSTSVLASVFLLSSIGIIVAIGTITGSKGGPPRNYQFLLDVSSLKNSRNTTGLPDGGDDGILKDFFVVYSSNYCSGKRYIDTWTITYCSKSGKQLFDYTNYDWEDYGVDFLNVTGTTPKRLIKRKGGGGGGRGGGGGKSGSTSSSSKSGGTTTAAVKAGSDPVRTTKAKALSKTAGARPVYVMTSGPTAHRRDWVLTIVFVVLAIICAAFVFCSYWIAFATAILEIISCYFSIELAVKPKKESSQFATFLKTYKGPNNTSISIKVGTTPFTLAWLAFMFLLLSAILWCIYFWLMRRTNLAAKKDAGKYDTEATRSPHEKSLEDSKAQEAPLSLDPAMSQTKSPNIVRRAIKFLTTFGRHKDIEQSQYTPLDGPQQQQQHDTLYNSHTSLQSDAPPPVYVKEAPAHAAFEPMRTKTP